jgi:hypothetical protein
MGFNSGLNRLTETEKRCLFETADTEILTFGSTVMADASGEVEQSLKGAVRFRET